MKTIILISCAKKKKHCKAKAKDLYTSQLFKKSLRYAEYQNPDKIFILSAKHELLDLETEIEWYDKTLNKMTATEVKAWAERVLEQLKQQADLNADRFIILAGDKYRKHLIPHLKNKKIPLLGLGFGKQLQFLKRKVK
jgi:hypothetical protein